MALNVGELYASFGIETKGLDKQISSIEQKCSNIAKGLTVGGGVMTAAITAPLVKAGKAVYKAGTDFESQMSRVEAISGASGDSLAALTQKALDMGSTTQFTATEAGEALEYMAMAGWKDESMLAGLEPVMNLAAASGGDLASTSDIVTDAMTAFGYTLESVGGDTQAFNKQITHFSDVLAAASTNANTNVQMMGESFKYVAPLAGTMGYSVDDIAVALGTMANAGIKGSQAGTSLQRIIQNMISPTDKQAKAMKKLGLSLYDSNGKIKSFSDVMGDMRTAAKESGIDLNQLQKDVGELDKQLANGEITQKQYDKQVKKLTKGNDKFLKAVSDLAGARGLSGMLAIMNASDAEFDQLTESILRCDGATAKMAQTMLDNAKGDVTIFKSAIEGLEITLWTLVAGPFRSIVQSATRIVDAFRKMNSGTQIAVMKMAGLAAAAGPAMLAIGRIVKFAPIMGKVLTSLISPLGIVAGGLALFAIAAVDANNDIGKAFLKGSVAVGSHLDKMNKEIASSMETVSQRMPKLINMLKLGLKRVIPSIVTTANEIVKGFAKAIGDNAENIADLGMTVVESIVNGISDGLPELIPAVAQAGVQIGTAILGLIPRIVTLAGNLGMAIVNGIINTDWVKMGTDLITAIGNAITGASNSGAEIVEKLVDFINENLTAENITALLTNATAFASTLFSTIVESFGTVGENGVNAVGKIGEAINKLLGTITSSKFTAGAGKLAETIITGLGDAIGTAFSSAGKIVDAITDLLSGAISKGSDVDLTNNLAGFGTSVINAIASAIEKAATGAADLIGAIGNLISTAVSGNSIGNLGSFGIAIIKAIVNGIKSAGNAAAMILSAIGTAISKVDWDVASAGLVSLGEGLIDAIVDAVTGKDFTDVVSAIGAGLGTAVGALADAAGTLISGLISFLLNPNGWAKLGEGLLSIVKAAFKGVVSFVENLDKKLKELNPEIEYNVSNLPDMAEYLETTFVQDDVEWVQTVDVDLMLNKLNRDNFDLETQELVAQFFSDNGLGTYEITDGVLSWQPSLELENLSDEELSTLMQELNQYIAEHTQNEPVEADVTVEPNVETGETTGEEPDFASLITEQLEADGNKVPVSTNVETSIDNVTVTEGEGTGIQEATQESVQALMDSVTFDADVAVTANVTVTVGDNNAGMIGTDLGNELGTNFVTAIGNATGMAATQAVALANRAAASLQGGYSLAYTAGTNFGQGFVNGMAGKLDSVRAKALELARAAVQSLQAGIQQGSPSKITFESGEFFGEGFVRGIAEKLKAVRTESSRMAQAAVDALNPSANAMSFSAQNRTDGLMTSGFGQMVDMMRQIISAIPDGRRPIVLDSGALVGGIADDMNERLGEIADRRGGSYA